MEAFLKPMAIDYIDFESAKTKKSNGRAYNRFVARWCFSPEIVLDTIYNRANEHIQQLNEKGVSLFRTEYGGQFAFLDAPTVTFEEIYNCGVIPLIRFNGSSH